DLLVEGLEGLAAHVGEHVQAVHDAVLEIVVDDDLLQLGVVVAVVQGAGAGEEVDVLLAVLGGQHGALGVGEHGGPAAGVAADARLQLGRVDGRGADLVGQLGLLGGLGLRDHGHDISLGGGSVVCGGARARGSARADGWMGPGGQLPTRSALIVCSSSAPWPGSGKWASVRSGSIVCSAPWRCAKEANSRWEAVLSAVIVVSSVVTSGRSASRPSRRRAATRRPRWDSSTAICQTNSRSGAVGRRYPSTKPTGSPAETARREVAAKSRAMIR